MPIAEFSNWLRQVICGRILRGRHHGTRLWNSVDAKWLWRILQSSCLFSVFSNINGEHESTLTTSKKYSWCIPVQKEIKPIIWGAAITPEPWNRQQCWFIFEDPNVRVARLLETSRKWGCSLSRANRRCSGYIWVINNFIPWGVSYIIGFVVHGLSLFPAWISNNIPCKVWDEITYPFPNYNDASVGMDK